MKRTFQLAIALVATIAMLFGTNVVMASVASASTTAEEEAKPYVRPLILGDIKPGGIADAYCGSWNFVPKFCQLQWYTIDANGQRTLVGRNPIYFVKLADVGKRLFVAATVFDELGNQYTSTSRRVVIQ